MIWVTGLSGAGKSTLSQILVDELRTHAANIIFLDGDELREVLSQASNDGSHHDKKQRTALALQYSKLCKLLASQGFTVVIATISLFRQIHEWNRQNLPGYFEIYLKVPLEELKRRDPKGIYKRFAAGEVRNVAGLDLDIDEPGDPDMLIEFDPDKSPDQLVNQILQEFT